MNCRFCGREAELPFYDKYACTYCLQPHHPKLGKTHDDWIRYVVNGLEQREEPHVPTTNRS
jgi:hypothetical protein